MKFPALFVIPTAVLLLVPSCRRAAPVEEGRVDEKAAEEQLAMERWQLARERAALQEELAEFDRRLQSDAESATERTGEFDKKKEELAEQAKALEARERALAEREAKLAADAAGAADGEVTPEPVLVAEPVPEFIEDPLPPLEEVDFPAVADYGVFYDDLSAHGDWYETSDYGYIWRPSVVVQVNNWRPYCNGRWVWTNCGWTWVSNEPFGWATYHYGRWTLLPGHGWVWVPGHCWAPAWVCWRQGGSHIGWAPLPPECADGMRPLWGSTVEREFGIGADWFCFVRTKHFTGDLGRHCLPRRENRLVLSGTTNVTLIHERRGRIISGGPDYGDLCRRLGRRLPQLTLDFDRLGSERRNGVVNGDRLLVTAPTVDADWNALLKPKRLTGRIERPDDPRHTRASVLGAIERISARRVEDRRQAEEQFQQGRPERFEEQRAQLLARQREAAMAEIRRHDGRVSSAVAADRRTGKPAADAGRAGTASTMSEISRRVAAGDGAASPVTRVGASPDQSETEVAGNTGRRVGRPDGVRPAGEAAVASDRRGRLQESAASRRLQELETAAMRRQQEQAQQAEQARHAAKQREGEAVEAAGRGREEAMQWQREQARVAEAARQRRDAEEAMSAQREQAMQAQQAEQQRVQAEARRRAQQQEQALRAQEEAQRRAREEAMRQQQEEARRAQAEAQRRAQQEAIRQQQEQARRVQEDAQRRAQEEAMRQRQQEQARQAREAAQRQAEEAARRQAQEAAQRQAEEAARQQAREAAAQRQAEEAARRQAQEAAQRQRAAEDRSRGRGRGR